MSSLRKNRDVCLIETINHITTNNCYCFSFSLWNHLLAMFCRLLQKYIIYLWNIFPQISFFIYLPYVLSSDVFFSLWKYLISCFHILKITCTTQLENMNILKKIRIPIVQQEISVICVSCGRSLCCAEWCRVTL